MGRTAGIGHQQQLDPRLVLQQLPGQVGQAPHPGRGIGDFAGTLLGERDQLRNRCTSCAVRVGVLEGARAPNGLIVGRSDQFCGTLDKPRV